MKQFIVLLAMIALGLLLQQIIMGPGEESIVSAMGRAWEEMIRWRGTFPGEIQ